MISSQEVGKVTSGSSTLTLQLKSQVSGGHYSTQRCCCFFYYCGCGTASILQLGFFEHLHPKDQAGRFPEGISLACCCEQM